MESQSENANPSESGLKSEQSGFNASKCLHRLGKVAAMLHALSNKLTHQEEAASYVLSCLITKGSVSYLSSPCFSTSLGGIGGPARGIHGILAVMYWISIKRGKWSWVQFPRVTRSQAPTLEAHFPRGRCPCSPA